MKVVRRATVRMPLTSEQDDLDRMWDENPAIIKRFLENRDAFVQLCSEVEYILRKKLSDAGIEVSAVTSRGKTLRSFAEKVNRKTYRDPITEVTDLAGARVVYLYRNDRSKIETIIEREFDVVERVDKVEVRDVDQFGYGALHYLVRLGKYSSGARYDGLRTLVCEIQVRTVLQDACDH